MKAALVGILALGVPMLLMMLISRLGQAPPRARPAAAGGTPAQVQPASRVSEPPARASGPALEPAAGEPFNLAERIGGWIELWRLSSGPAAESPRDRAAADLHAGRYGQAARAFDRLLTQSPDDPELLWGAAAAWCRLGEYEDALPLLRRTVEVSPENMSARYQHAVALIRLGRPAEALGALQDLLALQPGHARALLAVAMLHQSLGEYQEALATWRRITDDPPAGGTPERPAHAGLEPDARCDAHFHRGVVAITLHQHAEAEDCFRKVVEHRPADAQAWCNLGIARAARGAEAEAVAALSRAVELKPDLVPALNQLAFVHAHRFRRTGDAEDRDRLLELCGRSLAIQSYQPNLRALRNAVVESQWPAAPVPTPDQPQEAP